MPRLILVAGLLLATTACGGAQSARADRDKGLADSPVGGDLETEPLTGALLDGVRSVKDEDYAAAKTSLMQHLADNPKSAAAHYHLGLVALAQGKTEEAQSQFEQTLELNGQFHGAASMLGVMYFQAGEDVAATRMLEKAREISPQDARVQANLGAVYLRRGLWAEAMTAYEEATKLAPGHGTILYNYALAAMERFEYELAFEKIEEVLLYRPQFAMAHAARVVCLQGTGQVAKAEAAARKAVDELPEPLADNYLVLGRVLVVQKKPKDAEEFFAKAADMAPNSAAVQLAVGEFRDAMGDRAGALGWYGKYLKHKDRRPDDARRLRERVRTLKGKTAD
jgi:tetratricopeptide (TPR) repeat protein